MTVKMTAPFSFADTATLDVDDHQHGDGADSGTHVGGTVLASTDADDPRPVVQLGVDLHRVVNMAEHVLAGEATVYSRGASLVRVVPRTGDARARIRGEVGTPAIRPLTKAAARDVLSNVARWEKYDGRSKAWVPASPPADVAEVLLSRGTWPRLRPLAGVVTSPVLRPDGTVAKVSGYDAATGYLLALNETGAVIPSSPTRAHAIAARDRLLDLVADFPFERDADRAAWLALAITLVCRPAIAGACPMWTVSANVRGAGKSKLIDIVGILATGRAAARATHPSDEAEFGKLLTSIAVEGDPLVLLDNIDRPIGGGKLDAWLTGDRWSDRLLGTNVKVDLPIVTVLAVTGNNVEPTGDTLRRVLPVRLESEHEKPETRDDFRIEGDLLMHVRRNRDALARDLVTIAAAWFAAGRPRASDVKPWGSYESWGSIVPHMIRWVELENPIRTREGLEEDDPKTRALRVLFEKWKAIEILAGTNGLTTRELLEKTYDGSGHPKKDHEELAAALETLAPGRGRDRVDVRQLGYVFRAAKRRPLDGKRLDRAAATHEAGLRWTVR